MGRYSSRAFERLLSLLSTPAFKESLDESHAFTATDSPFAATTPLGRSFKCHQATVFASMQKQAKTDATENKTFDFIDNHSSFRAGNSTFPNKTTRYQNYFFFNQKRHWCRVDFKSGIFVESKSGKDSSLSASVFTLFEPSDCC